MVASVRGTAFDLSVKQDAKVSIALLRGKLLESEPVLLAVWNGKKNGRKGGTSEFIKLWESKQLPTEIIDINEINKSHPEPVKSKEISIKPPMDLKKALELKEIKRTFKAMLFADIVGYSKLKEEQLPYFFKFFIEFLYR